jgi:hypothetical protein
MVNKLLIALGVAALVAVGSLGAWKISSGSDRSVGALGPIDEPVPLAWRGEWTRDAKYDVGQVVSYEDSSYVAEAASSGEIPNAKDGPWALMAAKGLQGAQGQPGAQGPAGTFSGTLQSPDGKFKLTVTNNGIEATGPNTRLKIDGTRFTVDNAGGKVTVDTSGVVVQGPIVRLNCTSGGTPIGKSGSAQLNGQVAVGPNGGTFPLTGAAFVPAFPTVLAC